MLYWNYSRAAQPCFYILIQRDDADLYWENRFFYASESERDKNEKEKHS